MSRQGRCVGHRLTPCNHFYGDGWRSVLKPAFMLSFGMLSWMLQLMIFFFLKCSVNDRKLAAY